MANRAPFKLLFPAYLMALGAAVLIISPTILEFNDFRRNNVLQKLNSESQEKLAAPVKAPPAENPENTP